MHEDPPAGSDESTDGDIISGDSNGGDTAEPVAGEIANNGYDDVYDDEEIDDDESFAPVDDAAERLRVLVA
nr:hypothetical protein [Chloroflexia bacterium]